MPDTHFVILGHPRSGSTLVVQALRAHPGIVAYGELFQDEPESRRSAFRGRYEMYETGTDGASFLANSIFRENDDPDILAVGFKLFYTQAREPGARSVWSYLIDHTDLRIIHLTRDNALDAFISMCEARASGRWHVDLDETPSENAPIRIDPQECLGFLDRVYAYREWVSRAFQAHELLELSYERHVLADFNAAMRDVQNFLGVPPLPLPVLSRRQSAGRAAARITNYDEIKDLLRHTIHACAY